MPGNHARVGSQAPGSVENLVPDIEGSISFKGALISRHEGEVVFSCSGAHQGIVDGSPRNAEFGQLFQQPIGSLGANKATLWKVCCDQSSYRYWRSPLWGREPS
jgi:hypothetical protein